MDNLLAESQERCILADLREKTGLDYKRLGRIDINDKKVGDSILPILESWIDKTTTPAIRGAIFLLFVAPARSEFFDRLFREWEHETNSVNRAILTRFIALNVNDISATRVWRYLTRNCKDGGLQMSTELSQTGMNLHEHLLGDFQGMPRRAGSDYVKQKWDQSAPRYV